METSSLQSPQLNPTQNSSQASSSKNLKNWFDEFKAKVSKKSQQIQPASEAIEALSAQVNDDSSQTAKEVQGKSQTKLKGSNLRFRKVARNPLLGNQDLETASISNILNQSDNRKEEATIWRRCRTILSSILAPLKWIILYLIPFNYNLPWKLLCLINTSFVIIVIGLASGSTETSTVFSFANGFICGLAAGCVSFVILSLSFFLHILPKSQDTLTSNNYCKVQTKPLSPQEKDYIRLTSSLRKDSGRELDSKLDSVEFRPEDFSLVEVLEGDSAQSADDSDNNLAVEFRRKLDDDDYKGWMIEFIGDYELRNSSDIKLKSIFVKIENQVLYLCKTKNNYDVDSTTTPVIISQRVYDLNRVKKFSANLLLPKNVRNKQKYVWSKKYPINLEFQIEESNDTETANENLKQVQVILLARSCRDKEEWFRRFKRVVETKRLGRRHSALRSSVRSEESFASGGVGESLLSSFKRFRCRSPSPKRDSTVQTSQSSHLLSEPKKLNEGEVKTTDACDLPQSSSGLVRTKSCELIQASQSQGVSEITSEHNQMEENDYLSNPGTADDSTLTRETADLFSQAIDHSNFLESQPSLDYKDYIERIIRSGLGATPRSDWFNALIGRIFFDVFSHNHWSIWFKRKIQRKLYRIRLPYFMETLTLTKIDLGTNAPQFLNVVSHNFDSSGLFIDFDMAYSGGLTMTFETKLNLLKIKSDNSAGTAGGSNSGLGMPGVSPSPGQQYIEMNIIKDCSSVSESSCENLNKESGKPSVSLSASTRTSCESTSDSEDSDSDSSSDSSFDEAELNEISDWEDYGAEKTRQNIVKFVDKIASSRYFQHATENRYIKKKLKDISNCPLVLVVKIQSLNGVLTLNVPPPQTDRLWYGFKANPELILKAIPKMGDREVSLSHVTDWIERKLAEEFKKILVMPNMEDIVLPVLKSDHMQYITATR